MRVDVALPDVEAAGHLPPFAIARTADPQTCPVLGRPLQHAVSRLIAGMTVVLVHRDAAGDIRSYGDRDLTLALCGVDLDAQCWAAFDVYDRGVADARLDVAV